MFIKVAEYQILENHEVIPDSRLIWTIDQHNISCHDAGWLVWQSQTEDKSNMAYPTMPFQPNHHPQWDNDYNVDHVTKEMGNCQM